MSFSDPGKLTTQYQNASDLDLRLTLYQRFSVNAQPRQRWTLDQMNRSQNARILELGCGTASLWAENRDRIPETRRMPLTDSSPGMAADAKRNLNLDLRSTLTQNFTLISTDAQDTVSGDRKFDAVALFTARL